MSADPVAADAPSADQASVVANDESTLFNVLFAWKCSSTHHKLALDALRHLQHPDAARWKNLFLTNIESFLDGSKAPDNKFKDFKNHVLHVEDGMWGGAISAVETWYAKTVDAFRAKKWAEGVYNAGVLSHYFTDPVQPFHTGQSEAEGVVHRAAEWSIACAYQELQEILVQDLGGYPTVELPDGDDWLGVMVQRGAELSHPHYWPSIQHYDLKRGVKDPPTGLDQDLKDRIARLLGYAVISTARLFDQVFDDAEATPPNTNVTLLGVLAQCTIPIFWVTKKMKNARERAVVQKIYEEFVQTGKVVQRLPEDERTVRALHAEEVLKRPLAELDAQPPEPIGTAHGTGTPTRERIPKAPSRKVPQPAATANDTVDAAPPVTTPSIPVAPKAASVPLNRPVVSAPTASPVSPPRRESLTPVAAHTVPQAPVDPPQPVLPMQSAVAPSPRTAAPSAPLSSNSDAERRWYLDPTQSVEKAPSIGPKTAELLENAGVFTVGDLLAQPPESLARELGQRHIDAGTIRSWQAQAALVCAIPELRGHDAQMLVACGYDTPAKVAAAEPSALFESVCEFVATPVGERVLRGATAPDETEVLEWIEAAAAARPLQAA